MGLVHPHRPHLLAGLPVVDGDLAAVVAAQDHRELAVGQHLGVVRRLRYWPPRRSTFQSKVLVATSIWPTSPVPKWPGSCPARSSGHRAGRRTCCSDRSGCSTAQSTSPRKSVIRIRRLALSAISSAGSRCSGRPAAGCRHGPMHAQRPGSGARSASGRARRGQHRLRACHTDRHQDGGGKGGPQEPRERAAGHGLARGPGACRWLGSAEAGLVSETVVTSSTAARCVGRSEARWRQTRGPAGTGCAASRAAPGGRP